MNPFGDIDLKRHKKAATSMSTDDFISAAAMDDTVKVVKEPLKHVNINIPVSKHNKFKMAALTKGETMQQVVETAIDEYLNV